MANQEQLALLWQGIVAWNEWRLEYPESQIDLSEADLSGWKLGNVDRNWFDFTLDFQETWRINGGINLIGADLRGANLVETDLKAADLSEADLSNADLFKASLRGAGLFKAKLAGCQARYADLMGVDLSEADLHQTDFASAHLENSLLEGTNFQDADLSSANCQGTSLRGADLSRAKLARTNMLGADLRGAKLKGCLVSDLCLWRAKLDGSRQGDLLLEWLKDPPFNPAERECPLVVDHVEVSQFLTLLVRGELLPWLIEAMTSRFVVLIGDYSSARQPTLHMLKKAIALQGYEAIVVLYDESETQLKSRTLNLLAQISRFLLVDLTGTSFLFSEIEKLMAQIRCPVQIILPEEELEKHLQRSARFWKEKHQLPPYVYISEEDLMHHFRMAVLPAVEQLLPTMREKISRQHHRRIRTSYLLEGFSCNGL